MGQEGSARALRRLDQRMQDVGMMVPWSANGNAACFKPVYLLVATALQC